MGTWKEESLNYKYAAVPEEPPRYKKKKKKKRPKKADHRHEYKNCVIRYKIPDNWTIGRTDDGWTRTFASYCPICGKLGWPQDDEALRKLCPHVHISAFFWPSIFRNLSDQDKQEKQDFEKYVEEHYPTFVIEDYFENHLSGQVFLDSCQLDSVR